MLLLDSTFCPLFDPSLVHSPFSPHDGTHLDELIDGACESADGLREIGHCSSILGFFVQDDKSRHLQINTIITIVIFEEH